MKLPLTFPGRTLPTENFLSPSWMQRLHVGMIGLSLLLGSNLLSAEESWTTFQNGGRAVSSETVTAVDWSKTPAEQWSVTLEGYGQSSPVVWNGQVYLTSTNGPQKETYQIAAYKLTDGSLVWQYEVKNPTPQESNNYISKSAPTPAVDAAGLICFFEGGSLLALTHEGKLRWERNLVEEYGAIDARHGLSASVEQNQDSAFVWVERQTEPYVLCVDKKTGENRWKSPGLAVTSWASPRLVPVAGGEHLVLSGIGKILGLDPQTGTVLWTLTEVSGNSTPTPMPVSEGKFLIGATVGREGEGGEAGRSADSNGLIQIQKLDDQSWQASYVWHAKRATSSFGSPIAYENLAYFVNRTGVLYALDLNSGEELFAERLSDSTWATPLGWGSTVLFFGKKGTLDVIAAGQEFKSLQSTQFWTDEPASEEAFGGPVLYAAVIQGDQILIRRGDRLTSLKIPRS